MQLLRERGAEFNVKNLEGHRAIDVAEDPETKSELRKWFFSLSNRPPSINLGDYNREDYQASDDDDEGGD